MAKAVAPYHEVIEVARGELRPLRNPDEDL